MQRLMPKQQRAMRPPMTASQNTPVAKLPQPSQPLSSQQQLYWCWRNCMACPRTSTVSKIPDLTSIIQIQTIQRPMITDTVLREAELDDLYDWVDTLTLSRPKKNINRDFADAVMMAEVVHLHFPKMVELHNYPPGNSLKAKIANWRTLHSKVLSKLGISLSEEDCKRLSTSKPLSIEPVLFELKLILEERKKEAEENTFHNPNEERPATRGGAEGEVQMGAKLNMAGKVEELKEVYGLLKEKIDMVERSIERKDAHIRELETILKQYTNKNP